MTPGVVWVPLTTYLFWMFRLYRTVSGIFASLLGMDLVPERLDLLAELQAEGEVHSDEDREKPHGREKSDGLLLESLIGFGRSIGPEGFSGGWKEVLYRLG